MAKEKALRKAETSKEGMAEPELTGWKKTGRDLFLSTGALLTSIKKPWDSAAKVFNYNTAEKALQEAVPDASTRMAVWVFILSGIITFIMAVAAIYCSAFIANTQSNAMQSATGVYQPTVGINDFMAPATLAFITYLPVGLALALLLEFLAYHALKAMGGKGTFAQQLYLSSIVALAMSFISGLNIFAPVPCLQIIGGMCLIAADVYLALFVTSKAYSVAHKLGVMPCVVVAIVLNLIKLGVLYLAINSVSAALGMPPQFSIPTDILQSGG